MNKADFKYYSAKAEALKYPKIIGEVTFCLSSV